MASDGCFGLVSVVFFDFLSGFYDHNGNFGEVHDLLAVACFEDIIDENNFLLLWDINTSRNFDFPY